MLKEEIKKLAYEVHANTVENRRHLHAHPELSFNEHQTAAFVGSRLNEMGIPWQPMARTGEGGMIKGDIASEEVVALRGDMDALPLNEQNDLPYTSHNKGIMHACGHDAHTASLLGTAYILQTMKARFAGSVKLIFQPGEERLPGGASVMIREGVLENPKPSAIIGQHVMPSIPVGKIGIRKGKWMASTDEIYMTIHGKGGHGATPHLNTDPVLITAHILVALQQVVSRFNNPSVPGVLSFGKLEANGSTNVIPDSVYVEGTFRTLNEDWRGEAHERIKKMARGIAESIGGSCEIKIIRGYPALIHEEKLSAGVALFAEEYLGRENVTETDIWMAAEDFAYYSQAMSGCFYLLGTGNTEKGIMASLHSPQFNIDEEALRISTGLMAFIALKQLGNPG